MADYQMQATPESNPAMAALARMLGKADIFARKPFGYNNPPAQAISDLLGVPALQKTAERVGYGEPLTSGKGWASRMHPETEEALLAAPQFASPLGKMAQLTKGLPVGASIKPKGGNWLSGSVEDALKGLKRPTDRLELNEFNDILQRDLGMSRAGFEALPLEERRNISTQLIQNPTVNALNSWVDKQLTRYIKNEMATPEDPIRALAERGVLHVDPAELNFRPEMHGKFMRPGQTAVAQSPTAKSWEGMSDEAIGTGKVNEFIGNKNFQKDQDWLVKADPNAQASWIPGGAGSGLAPDLGFTHLMDELHNATNPASGLPLDLQLKYSSLNQVSVPQAVERVAKINEWRAAQKAEADMVRANNAATVLHKEYPENNPKGFKWVELRQADEMPQGWSEAENRLTGKKGYRHAGDDEFSEHHPARAALADALKYEGDTMGHCVGGYCDDVASGKSRIYSLRDAQGQPHVTVEVRPGLTPEELASKEQNRRLVSGPKFAGYDEQTRNAFLSPEILQIRGKANKKPNDEYLPYVQDFVKSGKWSDVGDLLNTGLRRTSDTFNDTEQAFLRSKGVDLKSYIEPEETARYQEMFKKPEPGFAHGGSVTADYDPSYLNHRVDQLRTELGL